MKLLLDANVLILWAVGGVGIDNIARFKETKIFGESHYHELIRLIANATPVVTASILAEASNLCRHREDLRLSLRDSVRGWAEERAPIEDALADRAFAWLGFSDVMIIQIATSGVQVITVDAPLHAELSRRACNVINLHHLVDLS